MLQGDQTTRTILNGGKLTHRELSSDLQLTASLCMDKLEGDFEDIGAEEFKEDCPLSIIVNVDIYQTIKIYLVQGDQTQLAFSLPSTPADPESEP